MNFIMYSSFVHVVRNLVLLLGFSLLALNQYHAEATTLTFSKDSDVLHVKEGESISVTVNISGIDNSILLHVESQTSQYFYVEGNSTFALSPVLRRVALDNGTVVSEVDLETNTSLSISIRGVFIGIGKLTFSLTALGSDNSYEDIEPIVVKVRRVPSLVNTIFGAILLIWLLLSYVSMGVKVNWPEIWKRLRRPWGVIVGALCQFIIMPLLAFSLAKLTNLDNASAVGLVILGCCPGGWISNIFTLILDCDLVLSITMTTSSTLLALAMMPLNLFLYGQSFASQDESLRTPFAELFIQLLILIIPVLIGMLIYYKLPKVAKYLKLALRPLAILLLIFAACLGVPSSLYIFHSSAAIYLVSIIFPIIGATLGLLFAKVACLDNRAAVTVAFETGCQNGLVALGLARLSYPYPEADLIARVPNLIVMATIIEGSLIAGIYAIMKRFPGRKHYSTEDSLLELDDGDTVILYNPSREDKPVIMQGKKASQSDGGKTSKHAGRFEHENTTAYTNPSLSMSDIGNTSSAVSTVSGGITGEMKIRTKKQSTPTSVSANDKDVEHSQKTYV